MPSPAVTAARRLAGFGVLVGGTFLLCLATACSFSPLRKVSAIPASFAPLTAKEIRLGTRASEDVGEAASDGLFVAIALAGGGSRSAVFAGEVLLRLHEMGFTRKVDFISGISSGSLAGSYYCLSYDPGEARSGDLIWRRDIVEDLMRRGVWLDYFGRYLRNPINLLRYYGTGLNRSYQMGAVLNRKFFKNETLADLNPRRPKLLVTATILETGGIFTFTDRQLAAQGIRSDRLRVADAVQASSSFPGVFHPYVLPFNEYRDGKLRRTRFIHLVDGGVYDNLGVTPLLQIYKSHRQRFPRGGVIIVADASLPVAMKEKLSGRRDSRAFTDYVIDFGTIRKILEILLEVQRLGLMRALRDDAAELRLRVVHLHYTTGLLAQDRDIHDELPNILDLDSPIPTNVDFSAKQELVAPTSLGLSERYAKATREAARRALQFNESALRALIPLE